MSDQWTVITADRLFDGTRQEPITRGVLVIRGDEIAAVGAQGTVDLPIGPEVTTIAFDGTRTVLPGLVDVHTHLVMPGDGTRYQDVMVHNDGVLLMHAIANARTALISGVTTLADTGARNDVTFTLRQGIGMGLCIGPRLVLCGRPMTITGGHCWFLNGEADGIDGVRALARQLLKEGADIIKVMATGGGTVGTYPYRPSYHRDELAAAAEEAHAVGKKAIAHSSATTGTIRSLDAGIDVIFHCHFYEPDGRLRFQDDVARRLADSPVSVNPTLHVNGVYVEALRVKADRGTITLEERKQLESRSKRYAGQVENVSQLKSRGVRLVAGSDAGWGLYPFGDLVAELEAMVGVGMSEAEVLRAATADAADALGVGDRVGSLVAGKKADILVVDGDPTRNIADLRNVRDVFLGGQIVDRTGSGESKRSDH